MSRIGNTVISIPEGVTVTVTGDLATVKGPKGELSTSLIGGITVEQKDNELIVKRKNDEKQSKAFHGLLRSLINNNVVGVSQGYKKTLKLIGTGYRVSKKGQDLSLTLGFSHPVMVNAVEGISLSVDGNDTIHVEGIDKQQVGQVAANIRKLRPPEPYKGKGVRYEGEIVRRKAGKAAAT
ncbi:MAG: 50S ribosomal protein L6 [Patescibacteria group bacterium]